MAVISVPKSLRDQLGDQGADDLVELLNRALDENRDSTLVLAEEKFERRLSEEMAQVNQRITDETNRLDQRIAEESSKLNQRITDESSKLNQRISAEANRLDQRIGEEVASLRVQIEQTKTGLIRWMFLFWVGQLAAMLGILFVLLR